METTLCQYGEVLFDELEQVAVRRGGFASLIWLRDQDPSLGRIQTLAEEPDPDVAGAMREASAYIDRVNAAIGSVQELSEIARSRYEAARQVTRMAREVTTTHTSIAVRLGAAWGALEVQAKADRQNWNVTRWLRGLVGSLLEMAAWRKVQANGGATLEQLAQAYANYSAALGELDAADFDASCSQYHPIDIDRAESLSPKLETASARLRILEVVWSEFLRHEVAVSEIHNVFDQALKANSAQINHRRFIALNTPKAEQIAGMAVEMAANTGAGSGGTREAESADHPEPKRDEVPTNVEMRSPTEEMTLDARLRRARSALNQAIETYAHVQKLRESSIEQIREARRIVMPELHETPSNFLSRWLVRHGWRRAEQNNQYSAALFEMDDIVGDTADAAALRLNLVGLAFSGGGIRSATFNLGVLQGLADLGLIKKFDYLSTVSGGGYIGAWLASWIRREGGEVGEPTLADPKDEAACRQRERDLRRKRERTAEAIENVQTQLRTSRFAQSQAKRRWVTGDEIASGKEGNGRPLKRVVEEEPEPIYHLRAFSNFLAPRVGLSSADTWTMVSVYLRNLMLNQFILLPLLLSLVLAPRLMLWLFRLDFSRSFMHWHGAVEVATAILMLVSAIVAFFTTYQVIARIRASRRGVREQPDAVANQSYEVNLCYVATLILLPATAISFCLAVLFAHPLGNALGAWYYPSSLLLWPWSSEPGRSQPGESFRIKVVLTAIGFGTVVGLVRAVASVAANLREVAKTASAPQSDVKLRQSVRRAFKRSISSFTSGMLTAVGLYFVLALLHERFPDHHSLAPFFATFGVPIILLAIGVGSAIEVGFIGGYEEEDMREWRASLGAYFLMIAAGWIFFVGLSIYGPLLVWGAHVIVSLAIAAGWISLSTFGVLAGKSASTGKSTQRGPTEYLTLVAPVVFLTGLFISIAMLASLVQQVTPPVGTSSQDPSNYLKDVVEADALSTLIGLVVFAILAVINCTKINVNLFSMNLFYTNRLVRCYLGASRPRLPMRDGRPNAAPSNCPVPARRPNPLTGFDPSDDFPLKDLAIVRHWRREDGDLVCDYRGPYHLINTAMNLVSGSDLAWQERMAESFLLSPLYCGSQSTGYRKGVVTPAELGADRGTRKDDETPEDGLAKGYAADIRLGTAVSISGAAASPNMGYHSSPLVSILLTVFNARLGLWLPNPAKAQWRVSGPGFSSYLIDELTGRTTDKGRYVYLSDGGHFENLGVYELIRRRCRYVVVCDAGADPELAFWDLSGLVRKCREDFGVRIEIDIAPLLKSETTGKSQWHCAVGSIRYDDVDDKATPGVLFYVKPSITGDEPSDVRNYVVEHPSFPHESTADQFFSESQFESYRVLGEHVAKQVFKDAFQDDLEERQAGAFFRRLKRRWFPTVPGVNENHLRTVQPFVKAQIALREDPNLRRLGRQLYPELHIPGTNHEEEVHAEVHAVSQMLQVMESAWLEADLDGNAEHPMNRGWMNVFRRWTNSEAFQSYWPALRGEFSEGFVRFCENELNLGFHKINAQRIGRGIDPACFESVVRDLDREFLLEWPELTWTGDPPERAALATMLSKALGPDKPEWLDQPAAWLIGSLPTDDTREGGPRFYGVILGWSEESGVISLLIWLRGAYRTLGIGRTAIESAMGEILREGQNNGRSQYTLRTSYPGNDFAGGKDRWQGTAWLNFFLNHGFYRCDGKVNFQKLLTVERVVKCDSTWQVT